MKAIRQSRPRARKRAAAMKPCSRLFRRRSAALRGARAVLETFA